MKLKSLIKRLIIHKLYTQILYIFFYFPEGSLESRYAAMTVAIFNLMERACKETSKGRFKFCHIEGEDGKLLIISFNKGLNLSISFDSTVNNDLMFTTYIKIIDLIGNSLSDLIQ